MPLLVSAIGYPTLEHLTKEDQMDFLEQVSSQNFDELRNISIKVLRAKKDEINVDLGNLNKIKLATDKYIYCANPTKSLLTKVCTSDGCKFKLYHFIGNLSCYFPISTENGVVLLKCLLQTPEMQPIKIELCQLPPPDIYRSFLDKLREKEPLNEQVVAALYEGFQKDKYNSNVIQLPNKKVTLYESYNQEEELYLLHYDKPRPAILDEQPISIEKFKIN